MTPSFGELKPVDLRVIWPKEASDFTPWLASNIQALGAALGLDLELGATETAVGDFSLDLLAKDLGSGRPVIVENQFGSTDHDHLGKLITYAAGLDAGVIIWIAETIREEHRQALEWLDRRTDSAVDVFGVVVEVFRIDDSRPAFVFKPVVFPNEWQRATRRSAERQPSARSEAYKRYFQALIDELREKHRFTGARVALPQNWYTFSSRIPGIVYGTSFALGDRVRAEVYIDQGEAEKNKALFDRFLAERHVLEGEFGEPLEWERLDDKRASRVAVYRDGTIEESDERLAEIRNWAIERLLRFKRVFGPRLLREPVPQLERRNG
jgi:hypothetical protein